MADKEPTGRRGRQQKGGTPPAAERQPGLAEVVRADVDGTYDGRDDCCDEVARIADEAGHIAGATGHVARTLEESATKLAAATDNVARTLEGLPALQTVNRSVTLRRAELENQEMEALWWAVNVHTDAISFPQYADFLDRVLCGGEPQADPRTDVNLAAQLRNFRRLCHLPGVDVYSLLRTATETFLLLNCGICPGEGPFDLPAGAGPRALGPGVDRLGGGRTLDFDEARRRLTEFLGDARNNYLETIIRGAFPRGQVATRSPFCMVGEVQLDTPCLLELIWSYWMEEGMLNQTVSAITLRFQNVRRPGRGPDPLAEFELDPLRPLSGFIWGYLQDEPNRLSVVRRAYEYSHHYGLSLYGRAVPALRPADPRSKFLEAFHDLLRQAAQFYREDNDTTVIADAFPVLNSLKEVHLVLSEGAHNQFRDLPWTARVEMLIQQWLLARPEMREFLRGRYMVAYPEPWMGAVDSMKRLQGWTDSSVLHFRDLARFGERILLSIRYGNWSAVSDQDDAKAWLRYWKEEIQGYVHAYQSVTGVNLSDQVVEVRERADARYLQPSFHLRKRLLSTRRQHPVR